jgi:hypothetical protein
MGYEAAGAVILLIAVEWNKGKLKGVGQLLQETEMGKPGTYVPYKETVTKFSSHQAFICQQDIQRQRRCRLYSTKCVTFSTEGINLRVETDYSLHRNMWSSCSSRLPSFLSSPTDEIRSGKFIDANLCNKPLVYDIHRLFINDLNVSTCA